MAPTLKLTYFSGKGAAEPVRLAFTIGGIEFEDERINRDELIKRKPELPFGALPALKVDDTTFSQSDAILHYAGRVSGLYPQDDPLLALKIDQINEGVKDVWSRIYPTFHMAPEQKIKKREAIVAEAFPRYVAALEKIVADTGFAIGDKLTLADVILYNFVASFKSGFLDGIPTDVCDAYPKIMKIYQTVDEHPKVKAWNEAHAKPKA